MNSLNNDFGSKGQNSGGTPSYRFTLESYQGPKSRYTCPECHKPRQLTRYVDTTTGKHIAPEVGRCNRVKKCGYHYTPKQYFERNPGAKLKARDAARELPPARIKKPTETSYHPFELATHHCQEDYREGNHFYQFLKQLFGQQWADALTVLYLIGYTSHYPGGTIFWQIDNRRRVRAGKVMQYNSDTGKRVKFRQNWVHSLEAKKGLREPGSFNLNQCLFGLHIAAALPVDFPIGIVESEKTAILLTALVEDFCWLATGGLHNLNAERLAPLAGRPVILFPDAGCYEDWERKAATIRSPDQPLPVSTLLRDWANESEKHEGYDLADYFLYVRKCQVQN